MSRDKTDRNKLPSREKISAYWTQRVEEFGVYDALQAELPPNECWACGNGMRIERCHIEAYLDGGPNEASNLVLLCGNCHVESETLPADTFWKWIRHMRKEKWKAPILHSLSRMDSYGYSLNNLAEKIDEKGLDATQREVGKALGVLKTDKLQ